MEKVRVLARSRSNFAGGVDELTFRGTGTLEVTAAAQLETGAMMHTGAVVASIR